MLNNIPPNIILQIFTQQSLNISMTDYQINIKKNSRTFDGQNDEKETERPAFHSVSEHEHPRELQPWTSSRSRKLLEKLFRYYSDSEQ